jgi:hypothetical protein
MMNPIYYKNIDETLYSGTLDNGLRIYVVPKKGFNKKYAFLPRATAAATGASGSAGSGLTLLRG